MEISKDWLEQVFAAARRGGMAIPAEQEREVYSLIWPNWKADATRWFEQKFEAEATEHGKQHEQFVKAVVEAHVDVSLELKEAGRLTDRARKSASQNISRLAADYYGHLGERAELEVIARAILYIARKGQAGGREVVSATVDLLGLKRAAVESAYGLLLERGHLRLSRSATVEVA
jgi:hypothetical protein